MNWMKGYLRDDGRMSSSVILSSSFFREDACLDLEALALNRADELLQIVDLLGLLLVRVRALRERHLAGLVPERVVPGVERHLAEVDVGDVGADLVQEVPVVGDDHHGVREVEQELLQPEDRIDVQVVRGLVQEEDVRIAEERLGHEDADLFAVGQVLHERSVLCRGDPQLAQQLGGLGFGVPAVQVGERGLQLTGAHAIGLAEVWLRIERVLLHHQRVQDLVAHDDRRQGRHLVEGEVILGKHAEPLVRLDAHGAGGRLDLARQALQERRLSGAVGADEPIAIAGRELDVHLFEQGLAAERDGEVLNGDHAGRGVLRRRCAGFKRNQVEAARSRV